MFNFCKCALLLCVASFVSAIANANADEQHLSAAQIESDIKLAQEAYSRVHPGYARYTSAQMIDAAWQAVVEKAHANQGMKLADFYLHVQKTLTLIRCDHTKAELPNVLREQRNTQPYYLPARIDVIERRGFVRIAADHNQLQSGDEILTIDDRRFSDVLDAVEVYVPYDGKTTWARNSGLTESLEFMGGAIDHFGALLWQVPTVATLEIRRHIHSTPTRLTVQVPRVTFLEWSALNSAEDKKIDIYTSGSENNLIATTAEDLLLPNTYAENFRNSLVFRRLGEHAAYLRVDTFVNYREPVNPKRVYEPVFKLLKDEKRSTLILDLRPNGGGSSDAQRALMAHLIKRSMYAAKDMRVATLDLDGLREHLWTWDKRALKPNRLGFKRNDDGSYSMRRFISDDLGKIKPAKYHFDGRVIALISNTNGSGTTNLLASLKEQRPITLVGEKTGGSAEGVTAGLLFTLTLPESQIKTRLPFFLTYNNVSSFEPGLGLTPDINVTPSADDWSPTYDPTLNRALRIIE